MNLKEREEGIKNFVATEIYACQSSLVEESFKRKMFSVDEIDNLYKPFDGKLIKPAICNNCMREFHFLDSETGECEECFEENQTPQEIFEWWLISPRLSIKLLLEGEPILDNNYGVWWGRCTTGQAITLDYVIQKLYDDFMGL